MGKYLKLLMALFLLIGMTACEPKEESTDSEQPAKAEEKADEKKDSPPKDHPAH